MNSETNRPIARSKNRPIIPLKIGQQALCALLKEKSLLGPLHVMFRHLGYFFQLPFKGFAPYVVSGPQANRQVLVTERDRLNWRNPDPVTDLLCHGLLVTDGDEHDHLRSLMDTPLSPGHLPQYVEMILRHTERVSATWQDGQIVDMLVESRKIALLIIMDALFGVDIYDDLPRLWTPILKAIEFISPGAWVFFRHLPHPSLKKYLTIINDDLYHIIANRRTAHSAPRTDLLQHLIDADLPDALIRDQMLTMLIAGHDTSTALLAWTFALLGQHPETLQQLTLELDQRLGAQPPAAPSGWQPRLLDDVIKESLRLYPPIHLGNRFTNKEMTFNGHTVSPGQRLFYSIYLTQRDPAQWDNPDSFCPERFSQGRKPAPFAFIPFGGGPRSCIGAAFSQVEARLVMARLLQTFHFTLTNPHIHAHMGATLEPRPGVMMKVTRRTNNFARNQQTSLNGQRV